LLVSRLLQQFVIEFISLAAAGSVSPGFARQLARGTRHPFKLGYILEEIPKEKVLVKFVGNYNVKNSGLMAEFSTPAGKLLGKLYKNVQSSGLTYTFRLVKEDGNIVKIEDQIIRLKDGVLYATLNLSKAKGLGIGTTIFNDALQYYGTNVKAIGGVWEVNVAYAAGLSDNLLMFRTALKNGLPPEQAAFATQTGKWAKDARFTKVWFENPTAPGKAITPTIQDKYVWAIFEK
jgi:hypothetical protein